MFFRLVVLSALTLLCNAANGQTDSASKTDKKPYHSPTKAAIYSAVIPGAGQLYNRKYWKLPLVYAGMGASAYLMLDQRSKMRTLNLQFEKAYAIKKDTVLDANLIAERDNYRRMRDFGIVDATVDAHFFRFNIDQNLSARIHPSPVRLLTVTYSLK
jgi:hypothetical protein